MKNRAGVSFALVFIFIILIFAAPKGDSELRCYDDYSSIQCEELYQAQRAADWSRFSAIVSLVGTVGLAASLFLSASAAKAAFEAANSAREQLHSNRAWIGNNMIGVTYAPDGIAFHIEWRNFGLTPAFNLTSELDIIVADPHDQPPEQMQIREIAFNKSTLFPNTNLRSPIKTIDLKSEKETVERNKKLYIISIASYRDMYNPNVKRETKICAQVVLPPRTSEKPQNVLIHALGPWNTAN